MACAKPLIVCSPKETPIVNFLENIGCAKLVTCTSAKEKACEIVNWLKGVKREELKEMGMSGYNEIKSKYSKDIVTSKYCKLLDSL